MVEPAPSSKVPPEPTARPEAGVARDGSGEGSRTALARLLEQEKTRGRTAPEPDPESPSSPGDKDL